MTIILHLLVALLFGTKQPVSAPVDGPLPTPTPPVYVAPPTPTPIETPPPTPTPTPTPTGPVATTNDGQCPPEDVRIVASEAIDGQTYNYPDCYETPAHPILACTTFLPDGQWLTVSMVNHNLQVICQTKDGQGFGGYVAPSAVNG